jgi:hypothetical protein
MSPGFAEEPCLRAVSPDAVGVGETVGDQVLVNRRVEAQLSRPYDGV